MEFALVLPILLVVVFGIINFGFVMTQKAALSNSARISARFSSVNAYAASTHTCASAIDRARNAAKTLGIGETNKINVGVTVKFVNASTGFTSTLCGAAPGAASSGATAPCTNAAGSPATPDTVTVETSFSSALLVPTPGLGNAVTLTGSSSFVCEYS